MNALRASLLTACLLGQAVLLGADFKVPPLSGPVVDQAGMLSPQAGQRAAAEIRRLWESGGSQYAVLTVESLEGEGIEGASIKVADSWKLGTAKDDRGVLVMIARNERKMRIEVGQGLEGDLTDAFSSRVIREVMAPALRAGDPDGAVLGALAALMAKSDPQFAREEPPRPRRRGKASDAKFIVYVIIFVVLFFFHIFTRAFIPMAGRRRGRGGYWGGGGGGGGGFGGGGGGFSGGGASGGW